MRDSRRGGLTSQKAGHCRRSALSFMAMDADVEKLPLTIMPISSTRSMSFLLTLRAKDFSFMRLTTDFVFTSSSRREGRMRAMADISPVALSAAARATPEGIRHFDAEIPGVVGADRLYELFGIAFPA